MRREEKPFSESLDELIIIFGKIREKAVDGKFGDIDVSFLEDFDVLMKNYMTVKDGVSEGALDSVSEPLKELVAAMIEQLKGEMEKVFDLKTEAEEANTFEEELDLITKSLKNPNLSNTEINNLLDQRQAIIAQQK